MASITIQQVKNLFINSMVADALGVPVEFSVRGTYQVTTMTGHGTYDQPVGSWSDDSSLTLCLAANLVQGGTPTTLMQKFVAYLQEGAYTPNHETFDVGMSTSRAIINFIKGTPAEECGDRAENANGNGALMRLSPLAFALINEQNTARRLHMTRQYTTITHGHERSIIASSIYVELLRQLLRGVPLPAALRTTHDFIQQGHFVPAEQRYFNRIWSPDFGQTAVSDIRTTGYVVDTLEAAIWLNLRAQRVDQVILTAANLGSDTDTVAQIATCLFSAAHPDDTVPQSWAQKLIHTSTMDQIITNFSHRFASE